MGALRSGQGHQRWFIRFVEARNSVRRLGIIPPMVTASAFHSLPEQRHSAELRKAVIAATIGTTIEWYDFFIYGTAAGLVFRKPYFPHRSPLRATLASL